MHIPLQNDETYFRQFISGFVSIWKNQLNLNLEETPPPQNIKYDLGPHIKRLPDELIPALQKFLLIAKSNVLGKVSAILFDLLFANYNQLSLSIVGSRRLY